MKIVKKLFQAVCLAALFLSAGFLIYHMVYLPMENKKLVAELKGISRSRKLREPQALKKKDQPAGRKCPVAAVDLVTLRKQYLDVQGWLTIPDTGIDYPVLQSEQENGGVLPETELQKRNMTSTEACFYRQTAKCLKVGTLSFTVTT